MFRWHWHLVSIAALCVICGAESAWAQIDTTSYGAREIGRLRNQAVGNYSVDRTIRDILGSSQVRGLSGATQSSISSRSFSDLGLSSRPASKPFSTVAPSPTVSPYMNLFREDISGESDLNYQTLVRPQLDQQRINAQVQRQNMELARRVQSLSARSDFGNPQGSDKQYPTGHPTSFNYLGSFYPSMSRR
jgi:hypothetical protein